MDPTGLPKQPFYFFGFIGIMQQKKEYIPRSGKTVSHTGIIQFISMENNCK